MTDSSPDKSPEEKNAAYDELKRLLLNEEQQSLEEIRHHLFDKKQRSEDIAEVLSDSVASASKDPEPLSNAMGTVIHGSISKLIKKDPQEFADALFPVMGPAIRKSINETLKSFMQSLNQVLEQNTSAQGLKWRFESWRKGVPYAELVLKNTLVYRVEEVFLIQPGSGLLMGYAAHPEAVTEDSDAVSAMLSAIQDFVRDSFAEDKKSGLETVELGEHVLWVVAGPQTILACAIRGIAPLSLRTKLQEVLEKIHIDYKEELQTFEGDRDSMGQVDEDLATCLEAQRATDEKEGKKKSFLSLPLIIILFIVFVLSSYFIWRNIDFENRLDQLMADLDARQGVILYESKEVDDQLQLKLLIDPLADSVDSLPEKYKFDATDLVFVKTAYQSLESKIILRRVTRLLNPPETATLSASNNALLISGVAPSEWITDSKVLLRSITDFTTIDTSALTPDYSAIEKSVKEQLNLPDTINAIFDGSELKLHGQAPAEWLLWYRDQQVDVEQVNQVDDAQLMVEQRSLLNWVKSQFNIPETVTFKIDNKRLVLEGAATYRWVNSLDVNNLDNPWINSIDSRDVAVNEIQELESLRGSIEATRIYFSDGTETVVGVERTLSNLVEKINRLSVLATTLDYQLLIILAGYTDGLGSLKKNQVLAVKRAEWTKQQLEDNGVTHGLLQAVAAEIESNDQMNIADRRVEFKLDIKAN